MRRRDRLRLWKHHARFAWDQLHLAPEPLPRRVPPLMVNLVVHTECVARAPAFQAVLEFARAFRTSRGVPITCCITTPACPWVAIQCRQEEVSEAEFSSRIRRLAEWADIGYHGHFFRAVSDREAARASFAAELGHADEVIFHQEWEGRLEPIGSRNHDAALIERQIGEEVAWLKGQGHHPALYVGGCWYMSEDIARTLERHGFLADCSLRRRHPDSFGGKYVPDGAMPERGTPWILPPTRGVAEIQSIFYPVDSPKRLRDRYAEILSGDPGSPRGVVLPMHEGEIACYAPEIGAHLDYLDEAGAAWTPVAEMAGRFLEACGRGRP